MAKSRTKKLRKGDRVEWSSHGGTTTEQGVATGKVVKKLTKPKKIKGHKVKASKKHPQYLVKSDNGGKAAHHPSALRRISSSKRSDGDEASSRPAAKKATSRKAAGKKATSRKAAAKKASSRKAAAKKATSRKRSTTRRSP